MDDSIPAGVRKLMERRGYTKRRGSGVSLTALAEATGVHTSTISNLFSRLNSRPATVSAVADALGISAPELRALIGDAPAESDVYVGPDASRRLSPRQRAALTELILATVDDASTEFEVDKADRENVARRDAEGSAPVDIAWSKRGARIPDEGGYDLAASYGEEGVAPDELPGS